MASPTISSEAQDVLRSINSWWAPPHPVRPAPPNYQRHHVRTILEALSRPGARGQVLRGPRQVGKSTALLHVIRRLIQAGVRPKDIFLIRFDLDLLREQGGLLRLLSWYQSEVRGGDLRNGPPFHLFLDEIHKLPGWDGQVKHVFDTFKPKMLLTGSSSALVARGQRESLAGRTLTIEMPPFSFREVLELTSAKAFPSVPITDIFEDWKKLAEIFQASYRRPPQLRHSLRRKLDRYYNRGGYPDLHTGAVEEDRWADYLVETVFSRVLGVDIPDLFPVDQPALLRHIYMEVARRTGQEISQKRLADEASSAGYSTNQPTVGRYLHYLTDALLIREFRRYPLSRKASAKVPLKYTLADLGVRNALFRGAPSLWESAPDVVGHLVETLVQSVLRGIGIQAHFYRQPRDRNGFDEVDFVVEALDGSVVPVEVKFRRQVNDRDIAPLFRFMEIHKPPCAFVVTRDLFRTDEANRIIFVPLMDFLINF